MDGKAIAVRLYQGWSDVRRNLAAANSWIDQTCHDQITAKNVVLRQAIKPLSLDVCPVLVAEDSASDILEANYPIARSPHVVLSLEIRPKWAVGDRVLIICGDLIDDAPF